MASLRERFGRPLDAWPETAFEAMAREVFHHQFDRNPVYAAYCRGRGRTPDSVRTWRDVPPVPATAFKRLELYSGLPGVGVGPPEAVFETSGTTGGAQDRGRHSVASLELYREASVPWFGANLVPENERLPVLALVPSPEAAPASSLSHMMGFVVDRWGATGSAFLADPDTGVDHGRVGDALETVAAAGRPALLMGTAFAWAHWLERAAAEGVEVALPPGSRLMETGGFKGRARAVPRGELYAGLSAALGIPRERIVNEYGMTELLSQMYESHLRTGDVPAPVHVAPPWLGIQVLDPETLEPRATGETGLLSFFDLANVSSVSAILTEDLGRLDDDGALRLEGRAPGSEPRGCSLAMEALLEARR